MSAVDVLIPTCGRSAALAVTLTSLCTQDSGGFRVVVSDQTEDGNAFGAGEVQAAIRVLRRHGHAVETHRHLPRRGIAEHRHFLLEKCTAPYALFLDDDLILEPWVVGLLHRTIDEQGCGFVGMSFVGLSYAGEVRPHDHVVDLWDGPVEPETVLPETPAWERSRLHNAANLLHAQTRLGATPERRLLYRVAWVPGCVMYDAEKLRAVGGFGFWGDLPAEHGGEDVLVQLRLMRQFGGCGVMPSGVYHQELPTSIPVRAVAADRALGWEEEAKRAVPGARGGAAR